MFFDTLPVCFKYGWGNLLYFTHKCGHENLITTKDSRHVSPITCSQTVQAQTFTDTMGHEEHCTASGVCNDVCSVTDALGHQHDTNEWPFFTDSSEVSLAVVLLHNGKGKGTAIPGQTSRGPDGSRRLSDLRTGRLYPPGNIPGTHFC